MGARRDERGGAQPAARPSARPPRSNAPTKSPRRTSPSTAASAAHGLKLIEDIAARKKGARVNVLTHCNAGWLADRRLGTATAPIYAAHDKGMAVHVYADETRPRNQGASLTAWELGKHGVPHTVIPDNTGGHLMQHGLVDLVIVGTDRVTAQGDVCNKIGTYLKALAAHDNNVPFYVALPSPTIDFTVSDGLAEIPIEQREPEEVATITGKTADGRIETVQHRAGGLAGRQLRLRRHAGAARQRADHRARRVGGQPRRAGESLSRAAAHAKYFPLAKPSAGRVEDLRLMNAAESPPSSRCKFPPTAASRRPRWRLRAAPRGCCTRTASAW